MAEQINNTPTTANATASDVTDETATDEEIVLAQAQTGTDKKDENAQDEDAKKEGDVVELEEDETLGKPDAGEQIIVNVPQGAQIKVSFNPDDAQISEQGDDLLLTFPDGSTILLVGFVSGSLTDNLPSIVLSDGTVIAGNIIVASLRGVAPEDLPQIETAAGPGAGGGGGGGGSRYSDDLGGNIPGLNPEGPLPPDPFAIQGPEPEFASEDIVDEPNPIPTVSVSVSVSIDEETPNPTDDNVVDVRAANILEGTNGIEGREVTFVVSLDKVYAEDVEVSYSVMPTGNGGSATPRPSGASADPADDYFESDPYVGTVTIPAGETEFTVTVGIVEDHYVEGNENFWIVLTDAVNATINPDADTATVTIFDDDHAPVPNDDTVEAGAEGGYTFVTDDILGNDTDQNITDGVPHEDLVQIRIVALPQYGTLMLDGSPVAVGDIILAADVEDGSLTYQRDYQSEVQVGEDHFEYAVYDGNPADGTVYQSSDINADPADQTAIVTIEFDSPPVAMDDSNVVTSDGESSTTTSGNVLVSTDYPDHGEHDNADDDDIGDVADTDAEGDPITVVGVDNGDGNQAVAGGTTSANGTAIVGDWGTLTIGADGSYTYELDETNQDLIAMGVGEEELDVFTYTNWDGDQGDEGTLTVHVFGINDAPVATPNEYSATEAEVETASSAGMHKLGNIITDDTGNGADSDPDHNETAGLTVETVDNIATNFGAATGVVVSSVTSDTPLAGEAARYILEMEDDGTAYLVVDDDGDVHIYSDGSEDPFEDMPDGTSGTITFDYTVDDGNTTDSESAAAQVTITINGTNDQPTATVNSYSATEAEVETASSAGMHKLGNIITDDTGNGADSDPDHNETAGLTVETVDNIATNFGAATGVVVSSVTSDTPLAGEAARYILEMEDDGTAYLVVDDDGDVHIYSDGSEDPFEDMPDGTSGTITFDYTVDDGNTTDSESAAAQVTITINGTNDQPTALLDTNKVLEGGIETATGNVITGAVTGGETGGVGQADTDPDHNETAGLLVTHIGFQDTTPDTTVDGSGVTISGTYGDLTIYENGTYSYSLTKDVPLGVTHTEVFTYRINDQSGTGTATDTANLEITVDGDPNKPIVANDTRQVDEAGLADGTNPGSNSELITDGQLNITDNGETYKIFIDDVEVTANGQSITSDYGTLLFDLDGSYTYTLGDNIDHDDASANFESYQVVVVDATGDSSDAATLTINIVDDGLVKVSSQNAVIDNEATNSVVGTLDFMGADWPDGSFDLTDALTSLPTNLTSGGFAVTYQLSNGDQTITAYANGSPVFTITLDPVTESYTFTMNGTLDADPTITTELLGGLVPGAPVAETDPLVLGTTGISVTFSDPNWATDALGVNTSGGGMGIANNLVNGGDPSDPTDNEEIKAVFSAPVDSFTFQLGNFTGSKGDVLTWTTFVDGDGDSIDVGTIAWTIVTPVYDVDGVTIIDWIDGTTGTGDVPAPAVGESDDTWVRVEYADGIKEVTLSVEYDGDKSNADATYKLESISIEVATAADDLTLTVDYTADDWDGNFVDDSFTVVVAANTDLTSGIGDDVMFGGAGHDNFVFTDSALDGNDVIMDFTDAHGDQIDLDALLDDLGWADGDADRSVVGEAVNLTDTGDHVVITVNETDGTTLVDGFSITVNNTEIAALILGTDVKVDDTV